MKNDKTPKLPTRTFCEPPSGPGVKGSDPVPEDIMSLGKIRFKTVVGKFKVVESCDTGVQNRDGKIIIVKDELGFHYLVAVSNTGFGEETFDGIESATHIRITERAYRDIKIYSKNAK